MNILVTGANGQLGNEMQIVSRGSADRYIFTDVCEGYTRLDITDLEAVRQMVSENDIRCIVNCAAWTNVDAAETAGEIVGRLNAQAPENLARAMQEVGGLLVHISTDYVFGGDPYNTPCREGQKGTPTGIYGLTKKDGEERIKAVFEQATDGKGHYVIIRTAWLYSEFGKNFCKTMLNLTATKPQLNVVFDQAGTPTYALDLAQAIFHIVENRLYVGHSGIYHYSNEGVCSWFDLAVAVADLYDSKGRVLPCRSDRFPSEAPRPAYSVLDKALFRETFSLPVPHWYESLRSGIR